MEIQSVVRNFIVGVQRLFVAFGALELVPLFTGLDLCTTGVSTLGFQLITKSKVPIFSASSSTFIAPIQVGME